ncbi:MAG TPA: hypothetical protein VF334_15440, partial [Polyangia bacterium]
PPSLESIVLHAIEKDRNRRFQNMNEFLAAVENPDAHAAQWKGLPAFAPAAASAPTMQSMPVVQPSAPASAGGSPRPTTLEGAAAEVTLSPRRPPRSRTPFIAVGAAVLALAGVGGWLGLSKKSSPPTETAAVAPPPAEAPKATPPAASDEVSVTVTSDPLGAKVYRADKSEAETQLTPVTFKLHRGDPPFDIQLRLEGYAPQTRTITSDESVKMLVSLVKLPALAPKAEAKAEAKPEPPPPPSKSEPAKTPTAKVSNVTKPPRPHHVSTPKKQQEVDPDGIIQPSFGN